MLLSLDWQQAKFDDDGVQETEFLGETRFQDGGELVSGIEDDEGLTKLVVRGYI